MKTSQKIKQNVVNNLAKTTLYEKCYRTIENATNL